MKPETLNQLPGPDRRLETPWHLCVRRPARRLVERPGQHRGDGELSNMSYALARKIGTFMHGQRATREGKPAGMMGAEIWLRVDAIPPTHPSEIIVRLVRAPRLKLCMLLATLVGIWTQLGYAQKFVDVSFQVAISNRLLVKTQWVSTTYQFNNRCIFGTNTWWIRTEFGKNFNQYFYCDGTNVFRTLEFKPIAEKPAFDLNKRYSTNVTFSFSPPSGAPTNVVVIPGKHPLADLGPNLCWLAFCSGDYLRGPGRLIPDPGYTIQHNDIAFGYRDKTRQFHDELGLPESLELFSDTKLIRKSPRDTRIIRNTDPRDIQHMVHPSTLNADGLLADRYTVENYTNFLGWNIPLEFTEVSYLPLDAAKRERVPVSWVRGKVTSICLSPHAPTPLIQSGTVFVVTDYRFRHPFRLLESVSYRITNGVLPSRTDKRLEQQYKALAARAPISPVVKARFGIYGLYATLLAPIIATVLWRGLKKNQQIRKEQV